MSRDQQRCGVLAYSRVLRSCGQDWWCARAHDSSPLTAACAAAAGTLYARGVHPVMQRMTVQLCAGRFTGLALMSFSGTATSVSIRAAGQVMGSAGLIT